MIANVLRINCGVLGNDVLAWPIIRTYESKYKSIRRIWKTLDRCFNAQIRASIRDCRRYLRDVVPTIQCSCGDSTQSKVPMDSNEYVSVDDRF